MALSLGNQAGLGRAVSAANPIDVDYSAGANNRILVLLIANADGDTVARTGAAPTINSVAMTQLGTGQAGSGECYVEMWAGYNLPQSGFPTISIPNTGTLNLETSGVLFNGTAGSLFGTPQQSGTSSASPSGTINNVPAGGAVVGVLGHGYKAVPTARSHTTVHEYDYGAYTSNVQYGLIADLSNVTVSWTLAGSDDVAMIVAAFQESEPPAGFNAKLIAGSAWSASIPSILIIVSSAWKSVASMKVIVAGAWKDI